jgi:hypothetical protein
MKKLLLLAALGFTALLANPVKAQVSVNVNIGAQPTWGPSGYDHVDYYYLPEVESYYDVPSRNFIYLNGNRWVRTRHLPARYRGYDLQRGRKVVINSPRPYLHHQNYRSQYGYASYAPNRVESRRVVYRDYPNRQYNKKGNYNKHEDRRGNDNRGNQGRKHDRGHGHGKH